LTFVVVTSLISITTWSVRLKFLYGKGRGGSQKIEYINEREDLINSKNGRERGGGGRGGEGGRVRERERERKRQRE
jgi:hypothetical protein